MFDLSRSTNRSIFCILMVITLLLIVPLNSGTKIISVNFMSEWEWSSAEVISTESTAHSYYTANAVDNSDNIHVVWQDETDYDGSGTDFDIFYKKFNGSWSTTEVVSTESTAHSYTPAIAIDSSDSIHVVWYDYTDYDGSGTDADIFYKKFNGSWSTTEVISTESTGNSYDPAIALDSSDNIHVVWYDYTDYDSSGTDYDIFYKRFDGIWSTTEVISTESTELSLYPAIAIDNSDNIHVVWEDFTNYDSSGTDYDIFYKRFDGIWSTTEVISTESTAHSYDSAIALDSSDNIHVVWYDYTNYDSSGTDSDIFHKSFDGSWSTTEVISTECTSDSFNPAIAIDSSDNIHVVWYDHTDYDGSGIDIDIFYKRFDGSWSTTEVISTESTAHSYYPAITVDNDYFLHIVWYDYTTNYDSSGTDYDIFYKRFSGIPNAPQLTVSPEVSYGIVNLDWDDVHASYKVYRDIEPIYTTEGLTAIADTTETHFDEEIAEVGTYFYAITATNNEGTSISNTVGVFIETIPDTVTVNNTVTDTKTDTVTDTETETETETVIIHSNITVTEDSLDFPVSLPLFLVSVTMIMIYRRKFR